MTRGVQTCSAADIARELDIDWVVHRIVWDQLDYRELCAHWVPKNPTDDDKVHCTGLYGPFVYSLDMLTLIKESSFGAETWLIIQNLQLEKRMCDREIIIFLQQRKWKHCHQ